MQKCYNVNMCRIATDAFIASEFRQTTVAEATATCQDAYVQKPNSLQGEERSSAWVGPKGLRPLSPAGRQR